MRRVQPHGLCLPGPASRGRGVGKGCGTRSESEGTGEQDDRTAEATRAATSRFAVLGTPSVRTALSGPRPRRRRDTSEHPLPIRGAANVASPVHEDGPERVRVTVKVTP